MFIRMRRDHHDGRNIDTVAYRVCHQAMTLSCVRVVVCREKCVAQNVSSRRSSCADVDSVPSSIATATDSATPSSFHAQPLHVEPAVLHSASATSSQSPRPRTEPAALVDVQAVEQRWGGALSGRAHTVDLSVSSGSALWSVVRGGDVIADRAIGVVEYWLSRSVHVPRSPSSDLSSIIIIIIISSSSSSLYTSWTYRSSHRQWTAVALRKLSCV